MLGAEPILTLQQMIRARDLIDADASISSICASIKLEPGYRSLAEVRKGWRKSKVKQWKRRQQPSAPFADATQPQQEPVEEEKEIAVQPELLTDPLDEDAVGEPIELGQEEPLIDVRLERSGEDEAADDDSEAAFDDSTEDLSRPAAS